MFQKLFNYKLTFLVAILICFGLFMPGNSVPSVGIPGFDKVVHFGMFFVFYGTLNLEALRANKKLPSFLYLLLSAVFLAVLTEYLQGALTSSRAADWKDAICDILGFLSVSLVWQLILHYCPKLTTFLTTLFKKSH